MNSKHFIRGTDRNCLRPLVLALTLFNLATCGFATNGALPASPTPAAILPALASVPAGVGAPALAAPTVITATLYLPVLTSNTPAPNLFGVNTIPPVSGHGLDIVISTTTQWVRGPFVTWSQVEPTPGARNWGTMAATDSQLLTAAQANLSVILVAGQTPDWAEKTPGVSCGPMAASYIAAFAAFMRDTVLRYSAPPYNVKYFELWNEPDIDPKLVASDSPIGCWGNDADAYYGGGDYGQMLAQVVPQMRAAAPWIKVLVGGLLLDCDPVHPPAGKTCLSSKFFEGVLRGGGGPFFDGVSFHAYDYYTGTLGGYANPGWNTAWNSGGPASRAKLRYLKSVLAAYGVSGKVFYNTELGLVCGPEQPVQNCGPFIEATKSDYLVEAYATAIADGLQANIWYSLTGWRNSGLVDQNGLPLPIFAAYKFASSELYGTVYRQDLTAFPGLTGFELAHGSGRVWVLWSADGATHTANLPTVPAAVYAVNGTPISPTLSLAVGIEPRYVQWAH